MKRIKRSEEGCSAYLSDPDRIEVIAPSLGRRFSGINASMLALIPLQARLINIVAMGFHICGEGVPRIGFRYFFRHCRRGRWRVWHARRNVDMVAGLILRYFFGYRLVLVFTSAAQRHHTWFTRFCYSRMEAVITPTTAAASYLSREATVVPHGINAQRFFPPDCRANEWAKRNLPGKRGLGIFGRIRPNKGTEEFVLASIGVLKDRPDWTAVIVGETTGRHKPFKLRLKEMVRESGLEDRIVFIGFEQDANAIPQWYRSLDIVVCASHVEGFGLPCIEAMASGCAVVATQTGAWPEVISNGENGFLVPTKSSQLLAEALSHLMDSTDERERIGLAAQERVRKGYRIEDEAAGTQNVYTELLAKYNG